MGKTKLLPRGVVSGRTATPKLPFDADGDGMNANRASWADAAIQQFMLVTGVEKEDALCDLFIDLAHWADRNGQDFPNELRRAQDHYRSETMNVNVVTGRQFDGVSIR